MMVIDEADLILSFGHKDDIDVILQALPDFTQSLLMSATLNKDVDLLKSLILHNPAILKLEAAELDDKLSQYSLKLLFLFLFFIYIFHFVILLFDFFIFFFFYLNFLYF
jgi:ATP-dependent RNA helicase DDX56/DBP9